MSSRRILVVPDRDAGPDDHWYSWLADDVPTTVPRVFGDVSTVTIPDAGSPSVDVALTAIDDAVGADLAETTFVGHGLGCHLLMAWLSRRPEGETARGVLLVGGRWALDDSSDGARQWLGLDLDLDRVKSAAGRTIVLISNDDPQVSDWMGNRKLWEERLGAEVQVVPSVGAFTRNAEPSVPYALKSYAR